VAELPPSAEADLSLRLTPAAASALLASAGHAAHAHADLLLTWVSSGAAAAAAGAGEIDASLRWRRAVATRLRLDPAALARGALAPHPGINIPADFGFAGGRSRVASRETSLLVQIECPPRGTVEAALAAALELTPVGDELCTAGGNLTLRVSGGSGGGGVRGVGVGGRLELELRLSAAEGASDETLPLAAAALKAELPSVAPSLCSAPCLVALRGAVNALASEVASTLALCERLSSTVPADVSRCVAMWQRETDEEMAQLCALLGVGVGR